MWKSGEELRKMFEEYEKEGRAMVSFYQKKTQSKSQPGGAALGRFRIHLLSLRTSHGCSPFHA